MTDSDSVLWQQAQRDYFIALRGASKAWADLEGEISEVNAATIQAGAATILIHHKYLVEQERIHVRVPTQGASGHPSGKGDVAPPLDAGVGIPECPQCGGDMYDNRPKKASGEYKPTSADFTCKDKSCKNEKGFRSGVWLPKDSQGAKRPKAEGAKAGVAAGRNFNEKPVVLLDEEDQDLPF